MSDTGPQNLNSKYAWRELARQGLPKRSASERVADFLEIYGLYDEATAREQASRCIQCPNPSCVTGCPLCNPIPQWMLLTAEGRFLEAAAVLGSVTNMAEICARLCPSDRLCEHSCLLDSVSESVPIQAIEQFLVEYAFAHGQAESSTPPPNGFKVAIVGSGPGGLACAEELARKGYAATIFDSALVPGGLLVNGTPAFKVDRSIIQRRLDLLKKRGVQFRLGVKLWEEVTLSQLRAEFDAVYLGFDSRKSRPLNVPGAELTGVVQALPFLLQKSVPIPLDLPHLDVTGKKVVVVGGGDTAMDCLRAAIRYGARETLCVYRRDETEMPCGRQEYRDAVEEGAKFVFGATLAAVLGNGRGQMNRLRLIRTQPGPMDGTKRPPVKILPGTEFEFEADWLVAALGFDPLPCPHSGELSELSINEWGGIVVNENQMTSISKVFAGGDIVRGPSLVLHAVRDARNAAASIDAHLHQLASPRHES